MYAETFVKLVEEEYSKVVKETESLKLKYGFELEEKPTYICDVVQKFRSWLTIAIRTADLVHNGARITPEDAVTHAAVSSPDEETGRALHPVLREALSLFDREQLDAMFGETRRLVLEQRTKVKFNECQYKLCYSHCQFVKYGVLENIDEKTYGGPIMTKFSGREGENHANYSTTG